jgi:hypothetical protein
VRRVYYSVSGDPLVHERYIVQLGQSIATLREHNGLIPVQVFVYGELPPAFGRKLRGLDVEVLDCGGYEDALRRRCPAIAPALARYPTLHRWLSLQYVLQDHPAQVLYVDCDTYFFADVEILLERYSGSGCYAREEPFSMRSAFGYDSAYIDESSLAALAHTEGARSISPFNIGVVIMDESTAAGIVARQDEFLRYVWRFMRWMYDHPIGEGDLTRDIREAVASIVQRESVPEGLAYPGRRRWIMDEVSVWLVLGKIPSLTTGFLSPADVMQDGEFTQGRPDEGEWVLCHYYSNAMAPFFEWIAAHNRRLDHPGRRSRRQGRRARS